MTNLLITLADFPDYVPFSVNIGAHLVTPHIRDAQTFDVAPLLGPVRLAELLTQLPDVTPGFRPADPDSPSFLLEAVAAGWTDAQLARVWYKAVRPLLVLESARRMLLWHGAHVTPNGLETLSDGTNQAVSGQLRTELRNDLIAKANHYRARLDAALRAAYPASYGVSCGGERRRRSSGGASVSAI